MLILSEGLTVETAEWSKARNDDLWPFLESMKQMEDRFNHWAGYDYVFLNEEVRRNMSGHLIRLSQTDVVVCLRIAAIQR